MSEMLEHANKWIADSGDDTEELQEAAAVITALKEAYLKFFNLHHTLAVNEAGIKGILCDALKIEHYEHSLHELSQMVTAKIKDLEIQTIDRGESYALAQSEIATLQSLVPVLDGSCDVCACVPATQITLCEEHEKVSRMSLDDMFLSQHDQPCDCAVCDDIAFRRSMNISGVDAAVERHDDEVLVLKAELITERLLSNKIRCDEKAALSKAEFWRVSLDAACEDAINWRRDAQELQGTLNDVLTDLQGRNIHLLSKHCWCSPTGHPWTQKGIVAE
jgi:hypothetical protein